MLGHAGFFTSLKKSTLQRMINVVKGVEPETGYGPIMRVSEAEQGMREHRVRRTKTVCTYCGVAAASTCGPRPAHPQDRARTRPGQRHLDLREGQVRLGLREQPGPADAVAAFNYPR